MLEQKDANAEQLLINEVNTGIMAVNGKLLKTWLGNLSNNNAQGEYYLDTQEGILLMCLAEALMRIPDAATADSLIKDKLRLGTHTESVKHGFLKRLKN